MGICMATLSGHLGPCISQSSHVTLLNGETASGMKPTSMELRLETLKGSQRQAQL